MKTTIREALKQVIEDTLRPMEFGRVAQPLYDRETIKMSSSYPIRQSIPSLYLSCSNTEYTAGPSTQSQSTDIWSPLEVVSPESREPQRSRKSSVFSQEFGTPANEIFESIVNEGTLSDMIRCLNDFTIDVNKVVLSTMKCSPLHLLARRPDCEEMISYLIENCNMNVDTLDKSRSSPLFYACLNGNTKACLTLLHHGASVNLKDDHENFPLLLAARRGSMDIVSLLVLAGADVNLSGRMGNTVLHHLTSKGDFKALVQFLQEAKDKIILNPKNRHDEPPIFCCTDQSEKLAYMLSLMKQVKQQSLTKWLMTSDHDGQNIIHRIAGCGNLKSLAIVVSYLSDSHLATLLNEPDDIQGNTPLHIAVLNKKFDMVKLFIGSLGINLNVRNRHGNTPLHLALSLKQQEISLLFLLDTDVRADVKNNNNQSALEMWVELGYSTVDTITNTANTPQASKNSESLTPRQEEDIIVHWSPKEVRITEEDFTFAKSVMSLTDWKQISSTSKSKSFQSKQVCRFSDGVTTGSTKKMYRTEGELPFPPEKVVSTLTYRQLLHKSESISTRTNSEESSPSSDSVDDDSLVVYPSTIIHMSQSSLWGARDFVFVTSCIYDQETEQYFIISKPSLGNSIQSTKSRRLLERQQGKLFSVWRISKGEDENSSSFTFVDCRDMNSARPLEANRWRKTDKKRHVNLYRTFQDAIELHLAGQ